MFLKGDRKLGQGREFCRQGDRVLLKGDRNFGRVEDSVGQGDVEFWQEDTGFFLAGR